MRIYIAGAHTDVGKTHFSALFCHTFGYEYFKLIQAGSPTDSDFVRTFAPEVYIHNAGISLATPASPHIGKQLEHKEYDPLGIIIPNVHNLLIELAGGILTPLDERYTMLDYVCAYKYPLILVGKYYVGCINHILLSLEAIKWRGIEVLCVVMNGEISTETAMIDSFLISHIDVPLRHSRFYDKSSFKEASSQLKDAMGDIIQG